MANETISAADHGAIDTKNVSWLSLPRKRYLAIILYARIMESLSQSCFASYMYHQLAWFNESFSEKDIAFQAGLVNAAFSIGSGSTAVLWAELLRHSSRSERSAPSVFVARFPQLHWTRVFSQLPRHPFCAAH